MIYCWRSCSFLCWGNVTTISCYDTTASMPKTLCEPLTSHHKANPVSMAMLLTAPRITLWFLTGDVLQQSQCSRAPAPIRRLPIEQFVCSARHQLWRRCRPAKPNCVVGRLFSDNFFSDFPIGKNSSKSLIAFRRPLPNCESIRIWWFQMKTLWMNGDGWSSCISACWRTNWQK